MAFFDYGNHPINSTGFAPVATASTSTLLAELDSTMLGTQNLAVNQKFIVHVTWILASDTNAQFQCETATSTALANGVDIFYPCVPTLQSVQFVTKHELFKDYRIRARMFSTNSGTVRAYLSAEKLT
jgi:hypothetical protein